MPTPSNPLISSLNSGEFSPKMEARVDFDRYPNAAKMCRNLLLLPQGGVTRRPGSRFIKEVKDSAASTVLMPFQYSEDTAYMVEAGNQYMRFYKQQARLDVADTDAAISNGDFSSNITGWAQPATTASQTDHEEDTTNATTYTFPAVNIGTAASNRQLILCVMGINAAATTARSIASVKVATSAGTEYFDASVITTNTGSAGSHRITIGIYAIDWPSQNSAKVQVTFSGSMTQCSMTCYRVLGHTALPADFDTDSGTSTSITSAAPDNSAVIGLYAGYSESALVTGTTWTGLTEDIDEAVEGNSRVSTAHSDVSSGSSLGVTAARAGGGGNETYLLCAVALGLPDPEHDSTNNRLSLPSPTGGLGINGYVHAEQAVSVGASYINSVHVLRFTVYGAYGSTVEFLVGTASGDDDVLEAVELGIGTHSIEFTPGATTIYVGFRHLGDGYRTMQIDAISFLDNAALELTTPYLTADLDDLRTFQAADVAYILHQEYKSRRVERRGDRSWSLVEVDWEDGPYLPVNDRISTHQRIDNPFFENGLVGWTDASAGDGQVFSTSNGAELDDGTSGGGGVGTLRTSFDATMDGTLFVMRFFIVNQDVTLNIGTSAGGSDLGTQTLQPGWNVVSLRTGETTVHLELEISGHTGERSAVSACLVYGTAARLLECSGNRGEISILSHGFSPFTASDEGRLIRLTSAGNEPGYAVITNYVASNQVEAYAVTDLGLGADGITEDWAFGAFGGTQGHPKCMGFFDGRLILANTVGKPQSFWTSQSADLQNMRADSFIDGVLTVEDNDAIVATLNSKRVDPILWLGELDTLIFGTAGAEWRVQTFGTVITPSDIGAKVNSAIPCGDKELVQVSQSIIFTDKTRRELHEMSFSTEEGGYIPELLTILSDHILNSPAHQLVYQRRPDSTLWCPRDDGRMATLAYNRQHQILGWSQHTIGGSFSGGDAVVEHAAVIPGKAASGSQTYDSDERDEVWLVVKRTINGSTKRYIEVLEGQFEGPLREDYDTEREWWTAMQAAQVDAFYVDSGITYSGASTDTITGLDHLEGETVKVWGNGEVLADATVSSGSIGLQKSVTKAQVGLGYKHKYLSLKLPTGAQAGTAINKAKAITACGVVVLDCTTFKIASVDHDKYVGRKIHKLYDISFRPESMGLTETIPLATGETNKSLDSTFGDDPRIYIESEAPGPFTLLAVAPMLQGTDNRANP